MAENRDFDRLVDLALRQESERHSSPCFEPEGLAAYMDGTLPASARAEAEAHIADCERCLAAAAAMVRTERVAARETGRSWSRRPLLIPLATAAGVLLAVFLLREPPVPIVREAQDPAPTTEGTPQAPPLLPSETSKETVPDFSARESRTDASGGRPVVSEQKKSAAVGETAARQGDAAAHAQSAVARREAEPLPQVAPLPPPPPAAPSSDRAAAAPAPETAQFRAAASSLVVTSPDGTRLWRVTGAAVEISSDRGATWEPVDAPRAQDIRAGSSPSATVCWLAGRRGLVLLTTDGVGWRQVDVPTSEDLVSISAASATDATVTTTTGRTYRTTDAGRTWTLQEKPSAPF